MILNNQQLQSRAREFALTNELRITSRGTRQFWPAFQSDMDSLHDFAEHLSSNRAECKQPAEDWLLEHISFMETQAHVVMRELPKFTLRRLPRLTDSGMPRIYAVCSDYMEHVDGRYDAQTFESFVQAYQDVSVLKVAECFALPSAMRVVIIRRLAQAMREVRHRHEVCHYVVSLLDRIGSKNLSDSEVRAVLERETQGKTLSATEVVHLVQHLSERAPDIRMVRDWLAAHVENSESSLEHMVSYEHQLQAELQVTCGNLVQSLHTLERMPWRPAFTRISHVEQILLTDHSGDYARMDDSSRDLMRARAADFARQLNVPETLVAQSAVELAQLGAEDTSTSDLPPRAGCLPYFLFDPGGVSALRGALQKVARPRRLANISVRRNALSVYLTSAALVFALLMCLAAGWTSFGTVIRPLSWLAVALALVLPVSEWAVTVVHAVIDRCCRTTPLLRYDFSEEVPEEARTMVVLPVIWSSAAEVDDVMDQLHVHYLANRQANLHFAVLADFPDASTETTSEDEVVLSRAVARLESLQAKYGAHRFFLCHRSRRYNQADDVYMGWERKRGKLVEFVELLSGCKTTSFTTVRGAREVLPTIRYVFTVDLDTKLPIGVVGRMVGTMHLPFNRPRLNREKSRVVEGYGVLQPTIGVSCESTEHSRFAALWAQEPGIDPYAFAQSNPFQDFLGQAVFVGKGLFDVAVFRQTLVTRIPDNHVLSHDVLEGGFLRAGLTADIEVVEAHPTTFYAYQHRSHRWIRGDWQLVPWLRRVCKDRDGDRKRVDLCGLTRWQIVDHVRRSLLPPALFAVAWLGLIHLLPGRVYVWETIVLLTVFLPFLRAAVTWLSGRGWGRAIPTGFLQSLFRLLTLPFTAVVALDAVLRTLYRMTVTRRNMLEWVPSAKLDARPERRRVFMYAPAAYVLVTVYFASVWAFGNAVDGTIGAMSLVLWLCAWPVLQWLNRPMARKKHGWVDNHREAIQHLAEQVWAFYERYVTAEESWLPPDNVQYHPQETIAHRTSPTNIGLYLASVVAARDLAFINTEAMVRRIEATMKTLATMEKWNGHLYNWYDTCSAAPLSPRYVSTVDSGNLVSYLMVVRQGLATWRLRDPELADRMERLEEEIDGFVESTDFRPLYNADERLFSLGFHVDSNRKESILYDLLASEARQASFVAIALGQVAVSHWFTLGRTMTRVQGFKTLLSWSGTMFEYMMPALLMRTYRNTVWDETYRGVVARQREYGASRRVPFGISESGYYAFDYQLNYQYRAFGVPGLGLDNGLERNLVVAPYATIMALPIAGESGLTTLREFKNLGASGTHGFYEAVDFTAERLPYGRRCEVIRSFMAHHQGMSLLTLVNLLTDDLVVDRFHADARVRAAELLLQERVPKKAALIKEPIGRHAALPEFGGRMDAGTRTFTEPTALPEVNVLSNGRMTSVTTTEGAGFLTWDGLAVSRWREDPVVEASGVAVYVHDVDSEETWSATRFPCQDVDEGSCVFGLDKSTFDSRRGGVSSQVTMTVSPDVDAEVRRVQLVNHSERERTLEVTSFVELALASPSADSAHPAFSKLFIETSHDEDAQCLLAKRRRREEEDQETWAVHTVYIDGRDAGDYEFETDRAAFIGRGYTLASPRGIETRLGGSTGSVADPAFVMRRRIQLAPKESATVYIVTGVAASREAAVDIVEKLREPAQGDRAFHLAWVRAQIDLRHLHLSPAQATGAHRLAARLLYTPPLSHLRSQAIAHNRLGQPALWPRGISGDVPIATVSVSNLADLPFVTLLARQHQYLCAQGLAVDLVVLDDTLGGYQDELMHRLREQLAAHGIGEMKRIVGLKASQLSDEEKTLLKAVSRVWLLAAGPSFGAQIRLDDNHYRSAPRRAARTPEKGQPRPGVVVKGEFFNGWGAFVEDGRAYQIQVPPGDYLARPWTNVIANPRFGCIVTELGTGYSWWRNSRECKLTPWNNDPVLDPPGECLYLRDLDTGELWSAAPKPAGRRRAYRVTHGWGVSRIEQVDGDITHTMETTVPLDDPLKRVRLTLRNRTDRPKRVAVTYYAEWVLGVTREAEAPYVVTEWDDASAVLLARNTYQTSFRDAVGFLHIGGAVGSWTANRTNFIGNGGSREAPAALFRDRLSCETGPFANSCGAVQTVVDVPPNGEAELCILLGCAASVEEVRSLIRKHGDVSSFDETLQSVKQYWDGITGQVRVQTPDRAMDVMMGGWLVYQALACRLWARTAFYQAGGAFGFRDQLQDSLALLHTAPTMTRQQILHNAAHQYEEGDVQHWWHEETGKGIRTRFSDDLLWLPYAVSRYLEHTGDVDIMSEVVPFLHSDPLKEGELERYEDTVVSEERATLLEHCLRAIRRGSRFGEHGIPLIGIGDWNDGMSRVGARGRGESVWLGWFLLDILKRFTERHLDILPDDVVAQFRQTAHTLEQHQNDEAWDGAWFRRAFTDDGRWLGTIEDQECRIDAIAQSWSVMSLGTSEDRQSRAMRSFDRELVDRELGVARLLTKAFDKTRPSPGYIQGYPPGIRENGGQYTHGVIWSIIAWAMLGRRDKAHELFAMLNPISHTQTAREVRTYGNEPYVMSADLYTAAPHRGRAGWSWYTGAAGWMYQAGLEYVLGVVRRVDKLYIRPCVPTHWDSFKVQYKYGDSTFNIDVDCSDDGAVSTWVVDGREIGESPYLQLVDDGQVHEVTLRTSRTPLSTVG